ncbi:hypothetical protein [Staphylococcus aureus]|uniref:hypothetical protein n=1 Tax=Staphylococcus aureus TaxID=1280 RepID=UPI000E0519C1|nr:Uncharacterised protein [Staphylococcus aureus]
MNSLSYQPKHDAAAPVAPPETPPIIAPATVPKPGITEAALAPPSPPVPAPPTVPRPHLTQLVFSLD